MVYIDEAHPSDGRQVPQNVKDGIVLKNPTTDKERAKVATEFAKNSKLTLPILVDGIDNKTNTDYAAWPDRIYVIDREGKIAYKGGLGPGGFKPADVPSVLDKLLKK